LNDKNEFVGALDDSMLFQKLLQNKTVRENTVSSVMLPPFPVVKTGDSIDSVARKINKENNAVMMIGRGSCREKG